MKKAFLILLPMFVVFFIIIGAVTYYIQESLAPIDNKAAQEEVVLPEHNVKIAFIGDSGIDQDFVNVLNLIKNEQVDAVVHLGDFDYTKNPNGFNAKITSVLGESFPYLVAPGNHDNPEWNSNCTNQKGCYARVFAERYALANIPLTQEQLDSEMYKLEYMGIDLFFVGSKTAQSADEYANYLIEQLPSSNNLWKVCNWHKNQNTMQVGGKTDDMGWPAYDACLSEGAIIATAHEHSYQRTKSLVSLHEANGIVVNPEFTNPNDLKVYDGSTFAFVSGLGGKSIRNQERCMPTEYPYGCNQEWAKIYTSNQGAKYGALFIEFNPDGDPYKANGYFKNVNNEVVDTFTITRMEETTTTATPNLTQSPTPTILSTTTPTVSLTSTPTPIVGASLTPTPLQSVTPTPTSNPTPVPTVVNSLPPITTTTYYTSECGQADSDNDGNFDIADFVSFATSYQDGKRTCDDKDVDYGACGGRDVNRDGKLNIADFGGTNGFASRYYPKASCALP